MYERIMVYDSTTTDTPTSILAPHPLGAASASGSRAFFQIRAFSCFPHARAVAEKPWCATPVRRRATRFLFTLKRRLSSCRGARLRRRLPAARQRGSDRAPAARFLEGSVIREAHVVAGLGTRTFPGAPATKTAAAQNFLFRRPHESSRADATRTYALRNGLLFRRAKAARPPSFTGARGKNTAPE